MPSANLKFDGCEITGLPELNALLAQLGKDMRTEILVPACAEVGAVAKDSARFLARKRSGALAQNIAVKVVRYPSKGTAVAIVGQKRGQRFLHNGRLIMPSKYAHLVEYGHVAKNGKRVAEHPFMRPTQVTMKGVAPTIMARRIWKEIQKRVKPKGSK